MMPRQRRHRTTRVVLPDGNVLPAIDYKIVEIILLLNRPGLSTSHCCQGHAREPRATAYVAIYGPLARLFCHLLLDDQLTIPALQTYYEPVFRARIAIPLAEGITLDTNGNGNRIAIRWPVSSHKHVTERFRRVVNMLPKAVTEDLHRPAEETRGAVNRGSELRGNHG